MNAAEPLKIVAIDDDADMAVYYKQALEQAGYRVFVATNGRTALDTILEVRPDAVLLDILMPVLQGYDVCRYLKSRGDTRATKVIVVSSLIQESDRRRAHEAGADAFLGKPIRAPELVQAVKKALS
jgi:CheY-like chemotaxis protein